MGTLYLLKTIRYIYYDYNYYNGLYYTANSQELPKGTVNIKFEFKETGGTRKGLPGGTGYLHVNGEKVAQVEMPEMHISTFSLSETFGTVPYCVSVVRVFLYLLQTFWLKFWSNLKLVIG